MKSLPIILFVIGLIAGIGITYALLTTVFKPAPDNGIIITERDGEYWADFYGCGQNQGDWGRGEFSGGSSWSGSTKTQTFIKACEEVTQLENIYVCR